MRRTFSCATNVAIETSLLVIFTEEFKMQKEAGIIVEKQKNQVIIEMQSSQDCHDCAAQGACNALGTSSRRIAVETHAEEWHEGDQVWLTFKSSSRIVAALLIFTLPLIFMMAGYAIVTSHGGSEGLGILGSLTGLGIGFFVVYFINKIFGGGSFVPEIEKQPSVQHFYKL